MKHKKAPSKKLLARREKIKSVALELFLTKGYFNTNLNDIIKLSGGSYSHIYTEFKNKHGLFVAILEDATNRHFEQIRKLMSEIKSKDLREYLLSFGLNYCAIFNEKSSVTLGKIVYSQIYNNSELSQWLASTRNKFSNDILQEYFKSQENPFLSQNASRLAELFCTMIKEPRYSQNIFINREVMSMREQKDYVEFVVDMFLSGALKGEK